MDNRPIEKIRQNETKLINELFDMEDKYLELKNINEKLSLALNSSERKIDEAISFLKHKKIDLEKYFDFVENCIDEIIEPLIDILER